MNTVNLTIADTDKISKKDVTFVQWEAKLQKVKNRKGEEVEKKVYALYSHTENCISAIEKLKDMLKGLVTHVYIAHKQWNAHNNLRANLDLQSVITVEDYQMNTVKIQQVWSIPQIKLQSPSIL